MIPFKIVRVAGTDIPFKVGMGNAADALAFYYAQAERAESTRARIEARSLLYGVNATGMIRLFGAEATEVAFADGVYRDGYTEHATFTSMPEIDTEGALPIDGRGLLVTGATSAGVLRPAVGDVTVVVEVDMPAHDGTLRVLASYVGPVLEARVVVYRSVTGIYALQVYNDEQELQFVGDLEDLSARRMRVAFTIGNETTRASFAGRPVVSIAAVRPVNLLRLWFGRLAKGQGDPLNGRVLRGAIYPYSVTDEVLRQMSGGLVTDDEITTLIDQKIQTHDQDLEAHELAERKRAIELADSKTGIWSVAAADNFNAADGAFTTAPTGGQTWNAIGGSQLSRIAGVARTPDNNLRGTTLNAGVADGQVEADLNPGTNEASIYFRFASNGNYLLLQRKAENGFIGLYRFVGGPSSLIVPAIYRSVVAGERYKVRFIGSRIWVFRIAAGEEELIFDATATNFMTATSHGLRLAGTGSADNFRVLKREAI